MPKIHTSIGPNFQIQIAQTKCISWAPLSPNGESRPNKNYKKAT